MGKAQANIHSECVNRVLGMQSAQGDRDRADEELACAGAVVGELRTAPG